MKLKNFVVTKKVSIAKNAVFGSNYSIYLKKSNVMDIFH